MNFGFEPCLLQSMNFKHKPKPLSLYLSAKMTASPSFSSPRFGTLPEIRRARNFSIFLSRGCGLPRLYENLFSQIVHSRSIFSCLSRDFPWGCAFCLLIKLILRKKLKYNLQVNPIMFHFACFLIGRLVSEIASLFHLAEVKILIRSQIKLL